MHRAAEIMKLATEKYNDLKPIPSVKFDSAILDLDVSNLNLTDLDETVEIENIDTISATLKALEEGYKPLVLNMANHLQPGGGFLSGAEAQEEHIFRCTNYFRTLTEGLYPIKSNEVILSPVVHILKDEQYNDLPEPKSAAFLAVAAIQKPNLNRNGDFCQRDYHITKEKIKMIYQIGVIGKYDCLILGALGCGAFYNPPTAIAHIFCDITSEYAQRFKKIVFAVKCSSTNKNCDIFQRTFLKVFNGEGDDESEHEEIEDDPYANTWPWQTPWRLPQGHRQYSLHNVIDDMPIMEMEMQGDSASPTPRLPYYIQNAIRSRRRHSDTDEPAPLSLLFDDRVSSINYICEDNCVGCPSCDPDAYDYADKESKK